MIQLIYKDKLFIYGKMNDVLKQINELSKNFKTIRDLTDYYRISSLEKNKLL